VILVHPGWQQKRVVKQAPDNYRRSPFFRPLERRGHLQRVPSRYRSAIAVVIEPHKKRWSREVRSIVGPSYTRMLSWLRLEERRCKA
jgi:hypothetical protein